MRQEAWGCLALCPLVGADYRTCRVEESWPTSKDAHQPPKRGERVFDRFVRVMRALMVTLISDVAVARARTRGKLGPCLRSYLRLPRWVLHNEIVTVEWTKLYCALNDS